MTPAVPMVKRDQVSFFLDPNSEPAVRVSPGTEVLVETEEANPNTFFSEDDTYGSIAEIQAIAGGVCPVTGPIYVEDAVPGECLVVTIRSIECGDSRGVGYTTSVPASAGLWPPDVVPGHTKICNYEGDTILFPVGGGEIRLPMTPFVGAIATAPDEEGVPAASQGPGFGGNMDCKAVGPGAEVVLPVNVEGALLYIGDVHAAQGDGEMSECAIETRASVGITVMPRTREEVGMISWPQVNTVETIGSIACPGAGTLADSIRLAFADVLQRLELYYGMRRIDAYQLLGQVGKVHIGQVLEPLVACVASIDRCYIE